MGFPRYLGHAAALTATVFLTTPTPSSANTFLVEPERRSIVVAEFGARTGKQVAAALAAGCLERKWRVKTMSDTLVECSGFAPNSMVVILRDAEELVRFVIVDGGEGVRVQGSSVLVARNGFGVAKESKGELSSITAIMIEEVGGQFTDGTRFVGLDLGFRGFDQRGFVVTSVKPESIADRAGMQRGDIITAVGGKSVNGTYQMHRRASKLTPGSPVEIRVLRRGESVALTIAIPQSVSEHL